MFIDISNNEMKRIMSNDCLSLPIRWDGNSFIKTLSMHFEEYKKILFDSIPEKYPIEIDDVCNNILETIKQYLSGHISSSYKKFDEVMALLFPYFKIYEKSAYNIDPLYEDSLNFYRVRNVDENKLFDRTDIFHMPYNLRSKVPTCRYSIAGYPSLYLSTELSLCCEEVPSNKLNEYKIASRYKLVRDLGVNPYKIRVIELAIKPQDYYENTSRRNSDNLNYIRKFDENYKKYLYSVSTKENYLMWYPLIASCSYIRISKNDPFAVEYIIPQMLMQWVRENSTQNELYGIRYFSCQSEKASDMGFNYVFPVSGKELKRDRFCPVLKKSFKLTNPKFISDFPYIYDCQYALDNSTADYI